MISIAHLRALICNKKTISPHKREPYLVCFDKKCLSFPKTIVIAIVIYEPLNLEDHA